MIQRCTDPKCPKFPRYGGRGIKVCDRWRHSFEAFLADMGERPSREHSIERRNHNGDYEPMNCKWGTRKEQANNKSNNRVISFGGKRLTLSQWAEEIGITYGSLRQRLRRHWTIQNALTAPRRINQFV